MKVTRFDSFHILDCMFEQMHTVLYMKTTHFECKMLKKIYILCKITNNLFHCYYKKVLKISFMANLAMLTKLYVLRYIAERNVN